MNGMAMYAENARVDKDDLVSKHATLVKRIAYHLLGRLPASVQVDDLIQAGMIGLLEAGRHYDPSHGASFETYAGIRIRGAMLDEIRRNDWAPRSVYKKARMISEAVRRIENAKGRDARDHEIAREMDIPVDEYHRLLQDSCGRLVFSIDDKDDDDRPMMSELAADEPGPFEGVQTEDFKRCLAEAISGLPERERLVLALYYDEELNLKEIGSILGVTESRISQIHSQAIIRLQARMNQWINIEE
jgi:RNA polymerase sigma factor for flagellar operon FliA